MFLYFVDLLLLIYVFCNVDCYIKNIVLFYSFCEYIELVLVYNMLIIMVYDDYVKNLLGMFVDGCSMWMFGKILEWFL